MKEAGVVRVRTSILRRQNTVAHFNTTRPILGLCEVADSSGGGHGSHRDGGVRRALLGSRPGRRRQRRRDRTRQSRS